MKLKIWSRAQREAA